MATEEPPNEPITPARPATGSGDAPPPLPPRELDPGDETARSFEVDGEAWVARPAGKGAGGTGAYGLGMIEAVHFARADDPATPLFEALLPAGRLPGLFDDELRAVLASARRIVGAGDQRSEGRAGRSLGSD
jgi:hypothetical protein